jgi:hypothetical protein
MKYLRAVTWTQCLLAGLSLNLAAHIVVLSLAYHGDFGIAWPNTTLDTFDVPMKCLRYTEFIAPNQVMVAVEAIRLFIRSSPLNADQEFLISFAGGLVINIWLSFFLGRQLQKLQALRGSLAATSAYLVATFALDRVVWW